MNEQISQPVTRGVHHLGLTVDDVAAARDFFVGVLRFDLIGERASYPAAFVTDNETLLSLWQVADRHDSKSFDRQRNVGLHHVAFEVDDVDALQKLHARLLQVAGITIEFGPEPLGSGGSRHLICQVPGGVRVEFIAPHRPGSATR